MLRFTRISSIYPNAVKLIQSQIYGKKLKYNQLLNEVLEFGFGEKDNISEELLKRNYECNEIITNIKTLQNKWSEEILGKKIEKDILIRQISYFKSNVIYLGNYSFLNNKFIKEIRKLKHVKLIIVFHCSPLTKKIEEKLKLADIIITCTTGYQLEIKKKVNKRTYLVHHAFNAPPKSKINFKNRLIDIAFTGSLYIKSGLHINRVHLIYNLLKKFDNTYIGINFPIKNFYYILIFLIKPNRCNFIEKFKLIYKIIYILIHCNKPVYGRDMIKLLNKSKILINSHIENTKYAGNMRLFEGTAMGCLVLTDNKIGLGKLFKVDKEIVVYKNLQDLLEKINFFLKNKKKLFSVAKKGYRRTFLEHNYKNRVYILDRVIKKNIKK